MYFQKTKKKKVLTIDQKNPYLLVDKFVVGESQDKILDGIYLY
jgi:hypothetical protein